MYECLARLADLPAGVTVLDIACGAGLPLHWLNPSAVDRYVGVDASPSMLARVRAVADSRGFRNATFKLADITDIPIGDGAADVCLLFNVLHCVPDPPAAVSEVTRCLAPGAACSAACSSRAARPEPTACLRGRRVGRTAARAGWNARRP